MKGSIGTNWSKSTHKSACKYQRSFGISTEKESDLPKPKKGRKKINNNIDSEGKKKQIQLLK